MRKHFSKIVSLLLAGTLLLGSAGVGSAAAEEIEGTAAVTYALDASQYRVMGVVQDLTDGALFKDGAAFPMEWNTYSADRGVAKASQSAFYLLSNKQVSCRTMYALIDLELVEETGSKKSVKLEWQFGALPKKWFRLDGEQFLNITGAGRYTALIDLGRLGLEEKDALQNIMVDAVGYSIRLHTMQIVMAKQVSDSGEYYTVGDTLYKQTRVAASQTELGLPAHLSGSGSYTMQGSSAGWPVYAAGTYLAVSVDVAYTDDDHFVFDRWDLRLGDAGQVTVNLLDVLEIDGPGHYEALLDLTQYGAGASTKWFGTNLGMAYGTIDIRQFELVKAQAVESHAVRFLDSFGREYAVRRTADGTAAQPPEPPVRAGYTFTGWKEDFSKVTADMDVTPEYAPDDARETYSLKVTNGSFSNGYTEYTYAQSDICTVKALNAPGSGETVAWVVKNGETESVIGYGESFTFRVTGPLELEARTVSAAETACVAYCDPYTEVIAEGEKSRTLRIPVICLPPEGCTLTRFGTVSVQGLALNEGEELTADTLGAVVLEGDARNGSGQWYRVMECGNVYYFVMRAFMEYTDAAGESHRVYGDTVRYGEEQPYVNLELREGDEIGVWWWHPVDMQKVKNKKYLNFLQKNGVTTIYGGFSFTDRETSAAFIEEANKRGMAVMALSGDSSWVAGARGAMEKTIQQCLDYNEWAKANGRGLLAGVHLDLEPANATQETWKIYAEEVKLGYEKTRNTGLRFEMCTSAHLDDLTAEGYSKENTPVDYSGMWLHEWVQQYSDGVVLMSYGDSADDAHQMSANELACAEKKGKGALLVSGQETGPEATHVTYYDDSKDYLYQEVRKLYELNVAACPTASTGVAFHNVQTWYSLE